MDDDREHPTDEIRIVMSRLRELLGRGDLEAAIDSIQSLAPDLREHPRIAELAKDVYIQHGRISAALGEASRLARDGTDRDRMRQARFAFGKLRETDTTWLPGSLSTPHNEQRTSQRILHHLKESLPHSETGFTFRSRMTLQAQVAAGYEPIVATALQFPMNKGITLPSSPEIVEGIPHYRLLDDSLPTDVTRSPYDIVLDAQTNLLSEIASETSPALIQAGTGFRGYETALCALAVATTRKIPFVYEVRGFQEATWTRYVERSESGEYYRKRRAQEVRCFQAADAVITIAEAMRADIVNRGIDASKVHVVPNAVDIERFSQRPKRQDLADIYGVSNRFTIGYISNLGAREGIDTLIEAVGLLSGDHDDVACLIIGDGPERERLKAKADQQPNANSFRLIGHVPNEQIEDHYALIDLFVVPRKDDRAARLVTPLKPLEAMAMARPVVVSDLPALREIVAPGERGECFAPGDARALADVLVQLIDDPSRRERYATAGRNWVVQERTVASNAARYDRILCSLT